MATTRFDPRMLPDPKDERVIRRIMRLTLLTLAGMLLALVWLTVFADGPATGAPGGDTVGWLERRLDCLSNLTELTK
jgi:hypothetical protein